MKERILMLNSSPKGKGTFWRCFNIARHLTDDFNIFLTCTTQDRMKCGEIELKDGVKLYYTSQSASAAVPRSFLAFFRHFDLVHAFAVARGLSGIPAMASKLRGKKLIVDWDDWWTRGGLYGEGISSKLHRPLEEGIPLLADAVTVASDLLKKRVLTAGFSREKVFKIVNGAKVGFIEPMRRERARRLLGLPQNTYYLLRMGFSMTRELETVLKALSEVIREEQNVKLISLSKGFDRKLKRLAKNLSIEGHIIEAGRVPREKVPLYLGAADVLLLPMDKRINELARFPIRLGDYLPAGRPILANNLGEVGRIVKKCGFTIPLRNKSEWAEKILTLLLDEEKNKGLGESARLIARNLSWEKIAQSVHKIYTSLLN